MSHPSNISKMKESCWYLLCLSCQVHWDIKYKCLLNNAECTVVCWQDIISILNSEIKESCYNFNLSFMAVQDIFYTRILCELNFYFSFICLNGWVSHWLLFNCQMSCFSTISLWEQVYWDDDIHFVQDQHA